MRLHRGLCCCDWIQEQTRAAPVLITGWAIPLRLLPKPCCSCVDPGRASHVPSGTPLHHRAAARSDAGRGAAYVTRVALGVMGEVTLHVWWCVLDRARVSGC